MDDTEFQEAVQMQINSEDRQTEHFHDFQHSCFQHCRDPAHAVLIRQQVHDDIYWMIVSDKDKQLTERTARSNLRKKYNWSVPTAKYWATLEVFEAAVREYQEDYELTLPEWFKQNKDKV